MVTSSKNFTVSW